MSHDSTPRHGAQNTYCRAIRTTYRNYRYTAADSSRHTVRLPEDDNLNRDENHRAAAQALCDKMGWTGDIVGGEFRCGEYYWVFSDESDRISNLERCNDNQRKQLESCIGLLEAIRPLAAWAENERRKHAASNETNEAEYMGALADAANAAIAQAEGK